MISDTVQDALMVFGANDKLTLNCLHERYRQLCHTWHPHRYANLTNNPQKYMEMYKKGQAKTKEIHAAYRVLRAWLEERPRHAEEAKTETS